ncbi:hypothetical protein V6N13_107948 [Hibiscus sabdariffa]|uniref:Wall-associated receptor kinase galacturonan-binding domain-containing protein n=1 Tax=Hibiscus sabdariffa TaxID=183260 RepID=A0ABR2SR44_9ROSI
MKLKHYTFFTLFPLVSLIFLPSLVSSQACQRTCGNRSGLGCGDPRFQQYATCDQQTLSLTTHTGSYPITSMDYRNQVIYISDPLMSTCGCSQPSKGFGLDWDASFSFTDDNAQPLRHPFSDPTVTMLHGL